MTEDSLEHRATVCTQPGAEVIAAEFVREHVDGPLVRQFSTMWKEESRASRRSSGVSAFSRSSSPGQLFPASMKGVVSAPGSPAKSDNQKTRW